MLTTQFPPWGPVFPPSNVGIATGVCSPGSGRVVARKAPSSCLCGHQQNENQLFRVARHRAGRAHVAGALHSTADSRQCRVFLTSPRTQVSWDPMVSSSCPQQKDQELAQPLATAPGSYVTSCLQPSPNANTPTPIPMPPPGLQHQISFEDYRLGQGHSSVSKMLPESTFSKARYGGTPCNSNAGEVKLGGPQNFLSNQPRLL